MSSFLRKSPFKNAHGTLLADSYSELKLHQPLGDQNLLAASDTRISYPVNDKTLAVLGIERTGKLGGASLPSYSHSSPVEGFEFSPHNPDHLVSVTSSGTVSLFSTSTNSTAAVSTFSSSITKAGGLRCHPSASGVVAAYGTNQASVMDMEASNATLAVAHPDAVTSFSWSYDGSTILTACKDKKVRVHDPRQPDTAVTTLDAPHKGSKPMQALYLGNSSSILTIGNSMMREREVGLWDLRNLANPLQRERMGTSNGLLTPLFDVDSSLLFLAGKGDSNIRIYELASNKLHPVNNLSPGGLAQRSVCMVPKRGLDIMGCEVARVLKLTDNSIQAVSFKVPRREKHKFCEDLFPPSTCSFEAAMDSGAYFGGKDATPLLSSLDPTAAAKVKEVDEQKMPAETKAVDTAPDRTSSVDSSSTAGSTSRFNNGASKFRHVNGKGVPASGRYFNLNPNISTMDGSLLTANETFFAMPWKGGGGQVYVGTHGKTGKVEPNCPLLNTGHTKAVTALSFSRFDTDILATGSDDCNIRIFGVTEEGAASGMGEGQLIGELKGHRNGIRTLDFHPTCRDLLMTSGLDTSVKIWDIQNFKEIVDVGSHHPDNINNCSWNYAGNLIATGSRDKMMRVIDPRSNTVVHGGKAHAGARGPRVCFCGRKGEGEEVLLSLGASVSGERELSLWDVRSFEKPLCTKRIDNGNGVLFPIFEESTGMLYLAGRGDRNVKYYEILKAEGGSFDALYCHEFGFDGDPLIGISPLPQKTVSVASVEVLKVLRLSSSEAQPATFTLPRNVELKEYFQDDVYREIRSCTTPAVSVSDWIEGSDGSIAYESLRPASMPLLSSRVVTRATRSKTEAFRREIDEREKEDKQKNDTFAKMQQMAITHEKYNPNKSSGQVIPKGKAGVDCTPIYDSDDSDAGWSDSD